MDGNGRAIRDWKAGDRFSAGHLQEAVEMLKPLSSIMGAGLVEVLRFPYGTAIIGHEPETYGDCIGVFAITGATQDGNNFRWKYAMAEHTKTAAGYGGWTAVSGGKIIAAAFNYQEEDNTNTGLMGNGVTLNADGIIEGTNFTLGPLPTGKGVYRVYVVEAPDGVLEYWFDGNTPLTGSCAA